MLSSSQPNKATPNSDSNGHKMGTTIITEQVPPQQAASLDLNKLQSLDQDAENLVRDGQEQRAEPSLDRGARLSTNQTTSRYLWQRLSLRTKATALAIALGTLPVLMVGATAYYFANQSITKQIFQNYNRAAIDLEDKLEIFMRARYLEIQAMADLEVFTSPRARSSTTRQEKDAELNRIIESYGGIYDSIAVFDLNGDLVAQSKGNALPNHSDRSYFQAVIKTNRPYISEPQKSKSSGIFSIYTAAPLKDSVTGKTVAIIRSRIPVDQFNQVFDAYEELEQEYFLVDSAGKIFAALDKESLGKSLKEEFPNLAARMQAAGDVETFMARDYHSEDNQEELAVYAPTEDLREAPYNLNWGAITSSPTDIAFLPQRQLLLTLLLGTGLAAVLISAIATYLVNRATRPILAATSAVEKLSQGNFDTRIAVAGEDEFAMLGSNINRMASQLQTFLHSQAAEAERAGIIKDITVRLSQFTQVEGIFDTAVQEIRLALKSDRVVVYGFNELWQGTVIAESVAEGWPHALGAKIDDPCFADKYVQRYRQGRVQATENIYTAGLSRCYLKQLEAFAVKANLVAPILQGGQLLGLLIAHQCDSPRAWQQLEIDFFAQLAVQIGYALDRANLLEQQKTAKEQLQKRAIELLMEVDPVSKGDLTIRASVTEDEIGTIADSYNATIGSLRKIVTQVQAAAKQVATTTSSSSGSVQELSQEALRQAQEIAVALDRIQEMSNSIRAVATNAQQAEAAVQLAARTVKDGDAAMNRTVEGMMAIRETVAQTSTKVKRLGEASQKISKVVKLINSFADQTNLLALNAAIEAARAGEQGRGFAVVADEVGTLARQSAEATAEIASLVKDIQTETNEVVAAMEAGTVQVASGTLLVDETRTSLNQIAATSAQISALVTEIASSAVTQSQASEAVSQTMTDVAAIARKTSNESTLVTASFEELLALATSLQASAGQFKVQ